MKTLAAILLMSCCALAQDAEIVSFHLPRAGPGKSEWTSAYADDGALVVVMAGDSGNRSDGRDQRHVQWHARNIHSPLALLDHDHRTRRRHHRHNPVTPGALSSNMPYRVIQ